MTKTWLPVFFIFTLFFALPVQALDLFGSSSGAEPLSGLACDITRCDAAETPEEMQACAKALYFEQEQELMAVDKELMDVLSPSQASSMRDIQKLWLDYRAKYCLFEAQLQGKDAYFRELCLCKTTMQRNSGLIEMRALRPAEPLPR